MVPGTAKLEADQSHFAQHFAYLSMFVLLQNIFDEIPKALLNIRVTRSY